MFIFPHGQEVKLYNITTKDHVSELVTVGEIHVKVVHYGTEDMEWEVNTDLSDQDQMKFHGWRNQEDVLEIHGTIDVIKKEEKSILQDGLKTELNNIQL